MKLAYWIAQDLDDSCRVEELLHIRAPRRKECKALIENSGGNYGKPRKVVVEYTDGFNLLDRALYGQDLAYFEEDE
jgi:hypothetical protein